LSDKDNSVREVIKAAFDKNAKLSGAPYDGLLGSLPDGWMPDPLLKEFYAVRGYLLNKYEETEVRRYLQSREELSNIDDGCSSEGFTPPELDDKLDALIYIKRIYDLGKTKGIQAYLGTSGDKIYRGIIRDETISERAALAGESSGNSRKEKANDDYQIIIQEADVLIEKRTHPRNVVSIIFKKKIDGNGKPFSESKIRNVLKKHPTNDYWRKKK